MSRRNASSAALLLRDVAYVIEAHFQILGGEANEAKHLDQFNRRARSGQCYTRPYLGCREFAADFALVGPDHTPPSVDPELVGSRDLGWMLHDLDFAHDRRARFFHVRMQDGLIEVPPLDSPEVRG